MGIVVVVVVVVASTIGEVVVEAGATYGSPGHYVVVVVVSVSVVVVIVAYPMYSGLVTLVGNSSLQR